MFLLVIGVFSVFAFQVLAQSPGKILKQAEKALGGAKNLQKIKSRQAKGTIMRLGDAAQGAYFLQLTAPNFYNESFDLGGFETATGYNGKSVWRRDSREGLRTLTGDISLDLQTEAAFKNNLWLNYKKTKSKLVSCGQTKIAEKPANCLSLTNVKGVSIKIYFDAASNLPVREEIPAGDSVKVFDFSDFRVIGGVQTPFKINLKNGEEMYEIKLDSVTFNPQIAQSDFDFPKVSGEPLPDVATLLSQLQDNSDKTAQILENYNYTKKVVSREAGNDGVLREKESWTYQVSFYKGFQVNRLIEKTNQPLNEKEQVEVDKKVQEYLVKIDEFLVKKEAMKTDAKENNDSFSIAEILRASLLKNPRRERFRGRDVIVFDFEPNPNFNMKNAKSIIKLFGKVGGVMWIDEKDKQVVRLEAALLDSFKIGGGLVANLKKGASFILEQERVNDEVWLPSLQDVNLSVKVFLVKGIKINQVVKSYDFRKFKTEVTDSKVNEVQKK